MNCVLQHSCMVDCKLLGVSIFLRIKLSIDQCPTTSSWMEDMVSIPCVSAVGSLMYDMVCTRTYFAQLVGALSQFMSNLECEHWAIMKTIFRYLWGISECSICY